VPNLLRGGVQIIRVGWDLDGVLADFFSAFNQLLAHMYGVRLLDKPRVWDWPQHELGLTNAQVRRAWDEVKKMPSWWTSLTKTKEIAEIPTDAFARLCHEHETYFITSRPQALHMTTQMQSASWLATRFGLKCPSVIIVNNPRDKTALLSALSLDFYIDDLLSTVQEAPASVKAYLLDKPYNQGPLFGEGVTKFRVKSIAEYIKAVQDAEPRYDRH